MTARNDDTKWHQQAKRMIDAAENEGGATVKVASGKTSKTPKKKKPIRTRAYKKLARNHPVAAPFAWLALALLTLIGKSTKGGVKYGARGLGWSGVRLGRGSKSASRRLARKIRADVNKRKWTTEGPSVNGKQPREHYLCGCGGSFTTAQALNRHLLDAHRGESRSSAKASPPELQAGATAKTAGKVLVLPAEKGGGRHRDSHRLPGARSVDDLVKAYRPITIKIGARIVALNDSTARLRRAAVQFGETPLPNSLAELRNVCVGVERAMGALNEAIGEFGMLLKRPSDSDGKGGGNIAATLVNPYFIQAQQHADGVGLQFTRFIAAFEAFYAAQIRAAGGSVPTPNLDLSKTG